MRLTWIFAPPGIFSATPDEMKRESNNLGRSFNEHSMMIAMKGSTWGEKRAGTVPGHPLTQ
jgi:hypothetical protein